MTDRPGGGGELIRELRGLLEDCVLYAVMPATLRGKVLRALTKATDTGRPVRPHVSGSPRPIAKPWPKEEGAEVETSTPSQDERQASVLTPSKDVASTNRGGTQAKATDTGEEK